MSKGKTEQEMAGDAVAVIANAKRREAEYLTDLATGDAEDVTSLDDALSANPIPYRSTVINGRRYHFEGMSPQAKDALIKKHSQDDGMGNTSVDQTMWRTDVIALTWVTGQGGKRIIDTKEKADRFFTAPGFAAIEAKMYDVAKEVAGLGDVEERRKNSVNGGGSSTSPTLPSTTSTLYPENSSQS